MKIILPLAALGILSTLFLLSGKVELSDEIPFAQLDLEERANQEGATNPTFAGVATGGEHVTFRARRVIPDPDRIGNMLAYTVEAELRLNGGAIVNITSRRGESDQVASSALLEGNVRVVTSTGYDLRTDRLDAEFETLRAESSGPVTGTGPPGELQAGGMVLTSTGEEGTAHLVFTGGVKLIYTPPDRED